MSKSLVSDIADSALASASAAEFRRSFIDQVGVWLAADHCAYLSMDRRRRVDVVASYGEGFLVENMPQFLQEMTQEELERALADRAITADDVYETTRTEQLALHRDFLQPNHIRRFLLRMWPRGGEVHWFAFGFASPMDWTRSAPRMLAVLDEIFPIVALTERALAERDARPRADTMNRMCDRLNDSSHYAKEAALWVATMLNRVDEPCSGPVDPSHPALGRYEKLAQCYQLTATELQWVLYLKDEPVSLRRAAEHFGVTLNTAKTHVKRIYEKTDTHRQAELLRLIMEWRANSG